MNRNLNFEIHTLDGALITWGLARSGNPELRLRPNGGGNAAVLRALIERAAAYALHKPEPLREGEKIALLGWMFRLREHAGFLELDELSPDGRRFHEGCGFSGRLIAAQRQVCDKVGAPPRFARINQQAVVSEDVLSGVRPIEGVRCPSPRNMSGWWITTDAYDGDTSTLRTVPMGHVIMARKDICAVLALPFGYRFRVDNGTNVWFDEEAAAESSGH